jgi:hypothetical protein
MNYRYKNTLHIFGYKAEIDSLLAAILAHPEDDHLLPSAKNGPPNSAHKKMAWKNMGEKAPEKAREILGRPHPYPVLEWEALTAISGQDVPAGEETPLNLENEEYPLLLSLARIATALAGKEFKKPEKTHNTFTGFPLTVNDIDGIKMAYQRMAKSGYIFARAKQKLYTDAHNKIRSHLTINFGENITTSLSSNLVTYAMAEDTHKSLTFFDTVMYTDKRDDTKTFEYLLRTPAEGHWKETYESENKASYLKLLKDGKEHPYLPDLVLIESLEQEEGFAPCDVKSLFDYSSKEELIEHYKTLVDTHNSMFDDKKSYERKPISFYNIIAY